VIGEGVSVQPSVDLSILDKRDRMGALHRWRTRGEGEGYCVTAKASQVDTSVRSRRPGSEIQSALAIGVQSVGCQIDCELPNAVRRTLIQRNRLQNKEVLYW
jgi:hypothetical protein